MQILVVGEDPLCCALGERLVAICLPGWRLGQPAIDTRGVTRLVSNLPRYLEQARYVQPVLCLADTDRGCAIELLNRWLPKDRSPRLLLRLAVAEAESWLLADREGFSEALAVSQSGVPRQPDCETDPKRIVLTLARRSRRRAVRDEVVSTDDPSKPGSGYNQHLCAFVRSHWNADRAATCSPSLDRAVRRLRSFGDGYDLSGVM